MKKILFLCSSVLFTNFLWSQITVGGYSNVEVGNNYTFQFSFSPSSPPNGASYYKLNSWQISSGSSNMNNSGLSYFNDNSQAFVANPLNAVQYVNIPIKWLDNSNTTSDVIYINASVSYYDSNDAPIGTAQLNTYNK
jgi:hypothetical protein